jgi:XRE family transcriptional regulator, regulator of sulfur utilization
LTQGLSQEVLAERAGLHRNYVGLVERGERIPTVEAAKRLAKGLSMTLAALITDAEQMSG